MRKEAEKKSNKTMIIKGLTVVAAKYGIRKGKTKSGKEFTGDEPVYQLSLHGDSVPYEDFTAFDDTPEKMVPAWYKEAEGYINLNSRFDIPVRRNGQDSSMGEWLEEANEQGYGTVGSVVDVKITQKDGVVYPVAVVVTADGEPFDPFDGMDD